VNQEIFEWLLLLGRWLHITVAVAWIGTSFFFMWLDRSFEFNDKATREGHVGELWMVHGGGFYHVEKLLMGPTKVPEHLHWFKWESYWTWMSGCFLVLMIFYTGNGAFLLDSSVSQLTYPQAIALGLSCIIGSWFFYDFLWERKFTRDKSFFGPFIGHVLTVLWIAGMSYWLCHALSGRAAYMHIGGMLGTWMTANVFLRIIPRQVKMVEAAKTGTPVNQDWAKNAKNRSTHNTYLTLPVIFIMLSNHFPSTYGNKLNWLILLVVGVAGACIREFFVVRIKKPARAKSFLVAGLALLVAVMFFSRENTPPGQDEQNVVVSPAEPLRADAPKTGEVTGGIKGVVSFEGVVPKGEKIVLPLACTKSHKGDIYSNEVVVNNGKLKNAVAFISKGLEGRTFADVPQEPAVVDQRDCLYEPRVTAVRVGQKVEFINSDEVFHNVRSITKSNEEFNVAMPNKGDRMVKVFTKPEVFLQTKCSVHPWMTAGIAVLDNPFFSVTDSSGAFLIKDVPVGKYTVEVAHEVFGPQTKEIEVKAGETSELDFSFHK
jgi:uncharacterized membrane protein/plastocyanin